MPELGPSEQGGTCSIEPVQAEKAPTAQSAICTVVEVGEREVRVAADADLRQVHHRGVAAVPVDGLAHSLAMASRTRQLSWPKFVDGLGRDVVAVVDDDRDPRQLGRTPPSARPRLRAGRSALGIGRRHLAFGEHEAAAGLVRRRWRGRCGFLIATVQPSPPLCECVTSTPGPILSNRADTASVATLASNGPVSGTIWRKYCSRACGSRENCTPGKKSGQRPSRNMLNQRWSSGVARDRRRHRAARRRHRAAAGRPGRPESVGAGRSSGSPRGRRACVSQVLPNWPKPCHITSGSVRGFTGTW